MTNNNFAVLVVEDDKHDVRFLKRAWKINQIANELVIVPHGQACLDFLRNEGDYHDENKFPKPGIILMDIRMPVMNGIECLQQIKADQSLKTIPVVMLTTSKEDEDRLKSYKLGANSFIQKPIEFDEFAQAVQAINLYWELSELP